MKTSEETIYQIKKFEGLRLTAYRCPAGVLTIGYGHTVGVKSGQRITLSEAEALLRRDLYPIEKFLNTIKNVDKQCEFDALADFAFNLGIGALRSSTLLKMIVKGASQNTIQAEFLKWVNAGGKRVEGLVKRREWEANKWAGL